MVFTTNQVEKTVKAILNGAKYKEGDQFCNALDPKDCITVQAGKLMMEIAAGGEPKIYVLSKKAESQDL